jgi:RimJ/RimL family protein N-acetyltransferase
VCEAELRDGRRVTIRPTRADDAVGLQALFFHLRPDDVRTRFFRQLKSLTDETAQHLCNVSYYEEMAFAAVIGGPESERIVGTSCYFLDPKTGLADVAYMVDAEWQGSGLGTLLQARMIDYAKRHGVRGFTADVLADNAAMLAVFQRSGCRVDSRLDEGAHEVRILFDEPPPTRRQRGRAPLRVDAAPSPAVARPRGGSGNGGVIGRGHGSRKRPRRG